MSIEIHPLKKIVIDGVSLFFGMAQSDVEKALGKGQFAGNRYYYHSNEMAIEYNADKKLVFVEFLGGIDGTLRPCIYDCSIFDTKADELFRRLSQENGEPVMDSDQGYTYIFPNISIGIYREVTPSDVSEMLKEMKALGISTDHNEDIEAETQKATHWATLGAGAIEYYQ